MTGMSSAARWVVLALTAAGVSAEAHHSRANFDLERTVEVEGTVTKWRFRNPHAYLWLEVTDNRGRAREVIVELGSIPNLKQMGMNRDSVKPGDLVTVIANPERDPDGQYVFFNSMTMADGTRYAFADVFAYSREAGEAAEAGPGSTDFTGKWDEVATRQQMLLRGGPQDYPLTDRGREVVARYDPDDEPWYFCQSVGLPTMIGSFYVIEITKVGDDYRMDFEMPAATRTIHMDMAEHPQDLEPSMMGHSIGRIEDGVLVVDTVGFVPTKWGIWDGLDSSAQKRVVERYSLEDDGHRLSVEFTVTDPVYLSAPWSQTHIKRYVPGYEITEYEDCDPEAARQHLEMSVQ